LSIEEKTYLAALQHLNVFSKVIGVKSYIFGGLTLDIWAGKLLRPHGDIDCLTENLHTHEQQFRRLFLQAGYQTKHLSNKDFLAIKNKVEVHLGHVTIQQGRIEWTHNGDIESIFFPQTWLNKKAHDFYELKTYTVKPEFEYVIKSNPALMNPAWKPRKKDLKAIRELAKILQKQNVDLPSLQEQVTKG